MDSQVSLGLPVVRDCQARLALRETLASRVPWDSQALLVQLDFLEGLDPPDQPDRQVSSPHLMNMDV